MQKVDIDGEVWVPTRKLASWLDLTDNRIRQLEDEGYLTSKTESGKKKFELKESVRIYIEYLKRHKENPMLEVMDDEARKLKAEADLKEAKAAIEQMKKAELEATMHRSDDVEAITTDLVMAVRAELLALPGMLAVDVASAQSASEAAGFIKKAVNEILNSLKDYSYNPEEYKKMVREREKWMSEETDKETDENSE
ncbi:MAG: protoporphyrinogen oxidase [Butyrivibrio sp.]|nr:protoporphyrinogen oxidase [Butyrivibrio sp.]